MRPLHTAVIAITLLGALALSGCGTSSPATTVSRGVESISNVRFRSAAITPDKGVPTIPALYTCDGKNTPPPLEWGALPAHTGELVLFVLGLKPLPGSKSVTISVEWALAGINPALHHLDSGQLPQAAHAGLNNNHTRSYSICPPRGETEQYQFELYGLPEGDAVPLKFNGLRILSQLVTAKRGSLAIAHGTFGAVYKRS
jgi:phosphatidylethanolamine-binding protein (PEBP) family uncharacterized protein